MSYPHLFPGRKLGWSRRRFRRMTLASTLALVATSQLAQGQSAEPGGIHGWSAFEAKCLGVGTSFETLSSEIRAGGPAEQDSLAGIGFPMWHDDIAAADVTDLGDGSLLVLALRGTGTDVARVTCSLHGTQTQPGQFEEALFVARVNGTELGRTGGPRLVGGGIEENEGWVARSWSRHRLTATFALRPAGPESMTFMILKSHEREKSAPVSLQD